LEWGFVEGEGREGRGGMRIQDPPSFQTRLTPLSIRIFAFGRYRIDDCKKDHKKHKGQYTDDSDDGYKKIGHKYGHKDEYDYHGKKKGGYPVYDDSDHKGGKRGYGQDYDDDYGRKGKGGYPPVY
jgi:hypothetical protein